MDTHFVYMWYDKARKMFYIGSHTGSVDDNYTSSSRWLSGEIRYRPQDFRRRIVKILATKAEAAKLEYGLICSIQDWEFGTRYYNLKMGKPKGSPAWNKGKPLSSETKAKMSATKAANGCIPWNVGVPMTPEQKDHLSIMKRGQPAHNKGQRNPLAADNGRRGANKQSRMVVGRRKLVIDINTWTWIYPRDDGTWYYRDKISNKKYEEVDVDPPLHN
jgi:hypothetical protein